MDKEAIITFINDNGLRIGELAREGNIDAAKLMRDYAVWYRAHAPKQESRLDSKEVRDLEVTMAGAIYVITPLLSGTVEEGVNE